VDQRCEGSRERIARMLRECVRALLEDGARRGREDAGGEDEDRLRSFLERERALRERVGVVRGSLAPGADGGSDLES